MRRRLPLALAALAAAVLALVLVARQSGDGRPGDDRTGGATPTPSPVLAPMEHLRALARIAREHGGNRAAGTAGDRASTEYVAGRLREAGYRVRLQLVSFPFFAEARPPELARVSGGARLRPQTLQFSGSGSLTGRIRPIPARGCAARDYAAVRAGEVARVRRGVCLLREKAELAEEAGAAAVLIVNDRGAGTFPGTLGRPGVRIPVLGLSPADGRALSDGARVRVAVRTTSETRTTHNVIADAPGGDPRRTVMAGAHLDSVPAGPGINDDGSGVAAVLTSAERLARERPPAGAGHLRFALWGAEELGLVGSRRYVRALPAAARRAIVAYVNLDMVASPHPRPEVYDTDDAIEAALRRGWRGPGRLGETRLGGRSDHASFARAGIPAGGLFTGADRRTDPCYHRPCDGLGNVDVQMLDAMTATTRAALAELRRAAAPRG